MPTKTKRRLTDDERAARREAERQLAQDATEQLLSSEGWQAWLRVRSQTALRRYSVINQLLIALQCPEASRVAGFKAWINLGYCVRKGESSLKIFAPMPPSKKQMEAWRKAGADPKEKPRTLFRLTSVFDRSQIAPLDPPATPVPLDPPVVDIAGEDLEPMLAPLIAFGAEISSAVTFEAIDGGAQGFYELATKRIVIDQALSPNQQVKTLLHELAHALVRAEPAHDEHPLTYAEEELVVECVAHIVCAVLGFDTSGYSIAYLASWAEGAELETIQVRAELVDRLARRLEDVLLAEQADGPEEDTAPPAAQPPATETVNATSIVDQNPAVELAGAV